MAGTVWSPPAPRSLRLRLHQWWQSRHRRSDTWTLTQRNLYILPTPAGWMFAATLMVLLVASINYQLNLGYLLTFLLAGAGVVSMHITHNTLRGLQMHLRVGDARHAGEPAQVDAVLHSEAPRARHGVGLRLDGSDTTAWTWVDVPPLGQASATLSFVPARRGWHEVPVILIETRFPLGLFRAWSVWRPAARVLAYPAAEQPPAPLPAARAIRGDAHNMRQADGGDVEGVRSYRRGDALKQVLWKKSAKALMSGTELVCRDTSAGSASELWLEPQLAQAPDTEARVARLTAWVLLADRQGLSYGLRLPARELAPGSGERHRRACLEALATWA